MVAAIHGLQQIAQYFSADFLTDESDSEEPVDMLTMRKQ